MNQSICTIDECTSEVGAKGARGWCPKHYQRWRACGDPLGRKCDTCARYLFEVFGDEVKRRRYCSPECLPSCSVGACDQPVRKAGWCASHYAQWQARGEVLPFKYKWATPGSVCVVCGASASGRRGLRRYCSEGCKVTASRNPDRANYARCLKCSASISLLSRYENGRLKTTRVLLCDECRRRSRRPALSARELAARDGLLCSLCHEAVDLSVPWPDRYSPSVDHVVPLALGGSDTADNLALAHLTCNTSKQARTTQ